MVHIIKTEMLVIDFLKFDSNVKSPVEIRCIAYVRHYVRISALGDTFWRFIFIYYERNATNPIH